MECVADRFSSPGRVEYRHGGFPGSNVARKGKRRQAAALQGLARPDYFTAHAFLPDGHSCPSRSDWCNGLAAGRSYVSDGYAHALEFTVDGVRPGTDDVQLAAPGTLEVRAQVAFAQELQKAVAYGTAIAPGGRRESGDTRILHVPRTDETVEGDRAIAEYRRRRAAESP